MTGKSSCGTNHLWRHLDRCDSYTSNHKQSLLDFASGSPKSTWIFSQKTSRDLLTKMVIFHEYPFTMISHKLFRSFVSSLQPKFQLYSRITLKSNVMAMFKSMKKNIFEEMTTLDHISLTTDLWTSANQTPFMVVTAHFITSNWTLNKRVISFKELPAPHMSQGGM